MVSLARHESGARAALRRAIGVVAEGGPPADPAGRTDLDDLWRDAIAADAIVSGWRDPGIFS